MFTRINTDACSISDRDLRNRAIYDRELSNIPYYRRGQAINAQVFGAQTQGLEMNYGLESQLFGLGRVANDCANYGAVVQANLQASTDPTQTVCIGNALAPAYTRGVKSWRNQDIYMSSRAKEIDWHFYSPPVEFVGVGEYSVNRYSDTVQTTKDALAAENKQLLKRFWGGGGC